MQSIIRFQTLEIMPNLFINSSESTSQIYRVQGQKEIYPFAEERDTLLFEIGQLSTGDLNI